MTEERSLSWEAHNMLWIHIGRSRHYRASKEGNQNSWQSWKTDAGCSRFRCFKWVTTQVWTCRFQSTKLSAFVSNLCQIKYHQKELRWSITLGRKLFHFCCLKSGLLQYCKVQVVQKSSTVSGALKAAWSNRYLGMSRYCPKFRAAPAPTFLKKPTASTYSFRFWQKIIKEVTTPAMAGSSMINKWED